MHAKTLKALLGYGLSSDLIEKINTHKHTLAELRALGRDKLLTQYTGDEIDLIKQHVDRTPIPEDMGRKTVTNYACSYIS